MGVNDLMIFDLEKLQEITSGDSARQTRPADEGAHAPASLQTETVPDLASISEHEAAKDSPLTPPLDEDTRVDDSPEVHSEAVAQPETRPEREQQFGPKTEGRGKRQFTLRDEEPASRRQDLNAIPNARYGGAGVYSMPVRYSGNGKFEKGRDYPREKPPEFRPVAVETSDFDLDSVERDLRRRGRFGDDDR